MHQYEWDQYMNMSETAILREMVSEELAALERCRGKAASSGQAKHVMAYTIGLAVMLAICSIVPGIIRPCVASGLLLFAIFKTGLPQLTSKSGCGTVLSIYLVIFLFIAFIIAGDLPKLTVMIGTIVLYAIVYGMLIWASRQLNTVDWLVAAAKDAPDKEIHLIVWESEDLYFVEEEQPWFASRKLIAGVLALAVLFSGLGIASCFSKTMTSDQSVEWVNRAPEANYEWQRSFDGYYLQDFDAGTQEVNPTIPSHIDGLPVVGIRNRAFQNETKVTNIVIPDTVTEIGSYAFKGCTSLQSITMGDQVTAIGGEAFMGCSSLTEFVVPKGVTEIRGNTFEDCTQLRSVILHDGITAIHGYAFRGCRRLASIDLPAGITEIRAYTFEECVALQSIVIPEGVTRIAAHAFYGCTSLSSVDVPDSVVEIGSSAFRECASLKHIILPENCAVNGRAFEDSPTQVEYNARFTPEQEAAIREEVENKYVEVLYFIHGVENGEPVLYMPNDDGYVYITDIEEYAQNLTRDREDLGYVMLPDYQEVLDYMVKAKELGAREVLFSAYSQIATDIMGEAYVVETFIDIDDMIAQCEAGLEES